MYKFTKYLILDPFANSLTTIGDLIIEASKMPFRPILDRIERERIAAIQSALKKQQDQATQERLAQIMELTKNRRFYVNPKAEAGKLGGLAKKSKALKIGNAF